MLATCVLSNPAHLELSAENQTEIASRYSDLASKKGLILSKDVTCTSAGVTALDCKTFKLCTLVNGVMFGAIGKCYPDNYNPNTLRCDPNYVCPPCTKMGFICLKNKRSFRLCGDYGTVIIKEQDCPSDYYCNEKCSQPCLKHVLDC